MIVLRTLLGLAALAAVSSARCADYFPAYFGRWSIAEAQVAPWVQPEVAAAVTDDGLVGKAVTYEPDRIAGPRLLRCARPDYRFADVPPEGLFQGNLPDPAATARLLGFTEATIRTLQTGCEGAIDFHFRDADTALFALNNLIYTLKKVGPPRHR